MTRVATNAFDVKEHVSQRKGDGIKMDFKACKDFVHELDHEKFMTLALKLAEKGRGKVSPNPMVGAVIVRDGRVIARGFHESHGGAHAEVNAVIDLKNSGQSIEANDIMYVTLEPCNHYGKTPPCSQLILDEGIKNLVVAMEDPNPLVAGKGIKKLRDNGVAVKIGIMEERAKTLNKVFIKNMLYKEPYCTAKWAMTLDGKMATDEGDSQWISSEASRTLVHKWRSQSDAVIIGSGTALADNPRLNVRLVEGENPYRVVIDTEIRLPIDCNLVDCKDPHKTIVYVSEGVNQEKVETLRKKGIQVYRVALKQNHVDLKKVFDHLYSLNICNVFLESGPVLQGALLKEGLIDSVKAFISPKISGGRIHSPFQSFDCMRMEEAIKLDMESVEMLDQDILVTANVRR